MQRDLAHSRGSPVISGPGTIVVFFLGLLFLCPSSPAPIVQQAAERDYDVIVRERRRMQESMPPQQIRQEAEERIQEKNEEVLAEMKRPPLDFPHFAHPRDPVARRALQIFIQKSTAEAAGIPPEQALKPARDRLALYAWLTAFLIVAAVGGHFFYLRRKNENNEAAPL